MILLRNHEGSSPGAVFLYLGFWQRLKERLRITFPEGRNSSHFHFSDAEVCIPDFITGFLLPVYTFHSIAAGIEYDAFEKAPKSGRITAGYGITNRYGVVQ